MSDDPISDEDKALFRRTMQAVKPLGQSNKIVDQMSRPEEKPTSRIVENRPPISNYNLSNHYHDIVQAESILSYCKQSIPRKRMNQLKKGQIPWQALLDLHGLNPDTARESLCHFIDQHIRLDHRCLLIIHGKGGRHGESPILKNHINHWLQQLTQVLAFHSALSRDGGNGALYVLLQRQR